MKRTWLFVSIFVLVVGAFFWRFFLKNSIPIPGDILLGTYYPWLSNHWGFPAGVPVKNPLMSDIVSLQYPWRFTAIEYFKSGLLPLWDPSSFLGESLIGNFQAGIFNPFNILFILPFSFNYIWGVQVMLQPLLAMICMYVLLKSWKLSSSSILLGSLAYGLSAPVLVWMEYNTLGFAICVFPLLIYFIDQYLVKKEYLHLLGLSAIVAFVIFAGYPQFLYYFLLASFVYLCYFLYKESSFLGRWVTVLFQYGFFVLLGLGLSAIQLVPGIESLESSIRGVDVVALSNSVISMPFKNVVMGIIPDYFGNPATYNYWGGGYYESFIFYTSIVALALSLWSFKDKKRDRSTILFVFALGALVFSLPTPISDFIQKLSFLGLKGSVSSRILFIYAFSISALGAIGLEYLTTVSKSKHKERVVLLDLILPSVIVGISLGTFVSAYLIEFFSFGKLGKGFSYFDNLSISLRNEAWPLLLVFISMGLIVILRKWKIGWLSYLFSILLVLDMFKFGWKYLPFTREGKVFPETPSLTFLEEQKKPFRIVVEPGELLTANTWSPYNLESVSGYNILLPQSTANYISFINAGKGGHGNSRFVPVSNFNSKLLDIANAKYLLVLKRAQGTPDGGGTLPYFIDPKSSRFSVSFQEGPLAVLENKDALDRFYTVSGFKVIPNEDKARSYINSSDFKPNQEVVLQKTPAVGDLDTCKTNLVDYSGESLKLTADCPKEGMLVVSNAFNPGWQALVNNQKTDILKANGNFLAMVLPKGEDTIYLWFSPSSFWYGLKISLVSLILLLAIPSVRLLKKNY